MGKHRVVIYVRVIGHERTCLGVNQILDFVFQCFTIFNRVPESAKLELTRGICIVSERKYRWWVLTLSIVQAILLEGTIKYGYMALELGQTFFQVFFIFVVTVDILVVEIVVATDNIVDFIMVIDVVVIVVAVVVVAWE